MKKAIVLILSLLLFVTFSFSVLGCKKKEEAVPEASTVEAPAPAATATTAAPAAETPAAETPAAK